MFYLPTVTMEPQTSTPLKVTPMHECDPYKFESRLLPLLLVIFRSNWASLLAF